MTDHAPVDARRPVSEPQPQPQPEPAPIAAPAILPTRPVERLTLANARMVLTDEVVTGSLRIEDGVIVEIDSGAGVPVGAEDCGGQLVMPGMVELHTDNLERHLMPRPGVVWPGAAAVLSHDGELASAGITTVFDAVRVGSMRNTGGQAKKDYSKYARGVVDHIKAMRAAGLTRADHRIHLRAEVCSETVLEELDEFGPDDSVAIISVMDHTPGQRQFADLDRFRQYHQGKYNLTDAEMQAHIEFTRGLYEKWGVEHEDGIVARARALGAKIASHDDTTEGHVARSVALGVHFAEFPTTLRAARACRDASVPVMMGAPNVLRGGSHSGNVAAMELAEAGYLDVLSSDYAPSALLLATYRLGEALDDLPAAVRCVTAAPAAAAGLTDRGRLVPGLRADLLRVVLHDGLPVLTGAWAGGRRIA
ncbi:MAG: alpha-D-ribose 1-methylphosphonate 5-triphosphate diphosphatase [Pseudomonadota bacterium]